MQERASSLDDYKIKITKSFLPGAFLYIFGAHHYSQSPMRKRKKPFFPFVAFLVISVLLLRFHLKFMDDAN